MRSTQELIDSITNPTAREQFDEALRAYSAGAYRAATIILWTAVMHDFTEKLRLLAESGDARAAKVIKRLDDAREANDIRGVQAHESQLLNIAATEFELITRREADELDRLGKDRNVCAHPSFLPDSDEPAAMTSEQVRAYARLVADAVLSQPPVVGKSLVTQFTRDTQSDSWPIEDVTEFVRIRYFTRARKSSTANIISLAVKSSIRPPDENNEVAGRCVSVIKAAQEINSDLTGSTISKVLLKWRDGLTDNDLLRVVGALGKYTQTWTTIGDDNVSRIMSLLATAPVDLLMEQRAFASGNPSSTALDSVYQDAIDRISIDDLELVARRQYPKRQWSGRTLKEIRNAHSWRAGERAMRIALNVAPEMPLDDLEVVCDEFLSNDQINRASDMPQIVLKMIQSTASTPGATALWEKTLWTYADAYSPDGDPTGHYDYSESREYLGMP